MQISPHYTLPCLFSDGIESLASNRFLDVWSFQLSSITFFVHEMALNAAFGGKFGTLMLNAAPYSCNDKCWLDLNFILFNSDMFSHYAENFFNFIVLYMLSTCLPSCKGTACPVWDLKASAVLYNWTLLSFTYHLFWNALMFTQILPAIARKVKFQYTDFIQRCFI